MSKSGFEPTPFHRLVGYILREIGREVGAVELAKIIYLIDVEAMRLLGRTITGEFYTRQKKGPLPMHYYSVIEDMEANEISIVMKPTFYRPKRCHSFSGKQRFGFDLSPEQEIIAQRVLDRVKGLRLKEIINLAYETEPMQNILKRESKSGEKLLGEHVDLSDVSQNPRLARWRENKAAYEKSPDTEYEAYFERERKILEEMFSA